MTNAQERVGMLLDTSKCMGCRGCQVACKQWNQLSAEKTEFTGTYQNPPRLSGQTWTLITFNEVVGKKPELPVQWLFRKEQCHHCGEASCLQVCPTGAIKRLDNGIVYIDQAICAGCKYCVETCPFEVPQVNHASGTAMKCRMCLDRVGNGLQPACATACPTGAIQFGPWDKMLQLAKTRKALLTEQGHTPTIYGETELGGLGAMYLLMESPEAYGLPVNPRLPHARIFGKWLLGIVPGLAILYAMWRGFSNGKTQTTEAQAEA